MQLLILQKKYYVIITLNASNSVIRAYVIITANEFHYDSLDGSSIVWGGQAATIQGTLAQTVSLLLILQEKK